MEAYREEDRSVVAVHDTGIGISARDLPSIIERFYRADSARDSVGGAGLGLAIARWIVGEHSAVIEVQSEPGSGTQVMVSFSASL